MKYLIDGYNVIHKIEQLKGKRLRSQREGLIRILEAAGANSRKLRDLTVVFDGSCDVVAPKMHSSLKIIFSRNKTADQTIEELIANSTFARDIKIVSDDRQVRACASAQGAKAVSVGEFLKAVFLQCEKTPAFKLDAVQAKEITEELAQIWLEGKGK